MPNTTQSVTSPERHSLVQTATSPFAPLTAAVNTTGSDNQSSRANINTVIAGNAENHIRSIPVMSDV